MVLRVDVVEAALRARYGAIRSSCARSRRVDRARAGGRLLDDALVDELAAEPALTLLCGRYEGFDERIVEHFATDAISIGRYVLAGGELAAMVVADAVLRKLPGRARPRRVGASRSRSARARGRARVPALHAPGRVARVDGARGAALRPPRARSASGGASRAGARRGRSAPAERAHDDPPLSRSATIPSRAAPRPPLLRHEHRHRQPRARPAAPRPVVRAPGDRVRVHFQVIEGTRRRTQVFEGVVIKRQGHGVRETFTVRKQSFGVGVERTFPRALAEDRADRGRRSRRRAPRQAVLPARPGRQARPRARAPSTCVPRRRRAGLLYEEEAVAGGTDEAGEPAAEAEPEANRRGRAGDARRARGRRGEADETAEEQAPADDGETDSRGE